MTVLHQTLRVTSSNNSLNEDLNWNMQYLKRTYGNDVTINLKNIVCVDSATGDSLAYYDIIR